MDLKLCLVHEVTDVLLISLIFCTHFTYFFILLISSTYTSRTSQDTSTHVYVCICFFENTTTSVPLSLSDRY